MRFTAAGVALATGFGIACRVAKRRTGGEERLTRTPWRHVLRTSPLQQLDHDVPPRLPRLSRRWVGRGIQRIAIGGDTLILLAALAGRLRTTRASASDHAASKMEQRVPSGRVTLAEWPAVSYGSPTLCNYVSVADDLARVEPQRVRSVPARRMATVSRAAFSQSTQLALPLLIGQEFVADAAFADGSHIFHNVFVDLCFLREIIRPGGLIVLDDCDWASVATAVRYFELNTHWTPHPMEGRHVCARSASRVPGSNQHSKSSSYSLFDPLYAARRARVPRI